MEILREARQKASLLVVEDDPAMMVAFRDILESSGYHVNTAPNGQAALSLLENFSPTLILSDISMPVMDGIELYKEVRKRPDGAAIPFIFVTAHGRREDEFAARVLGADDYITKPVTSKELLSAVQARLQRTDELMVAQLKRALRTLANAIEARDKYTREHVEQVNAYAQAMAADQGWTESQREALEFGAILHDIGKIHIRESTLLKTGPLDPDEWEEMRKHPIIGARMIEGIPYLSPSIPLVLYHHERWDGEGYPEGRAGEDIPIEARLLAVADTFHAMTSDRPYREAIPPEKAFQEIKELAGKQFDPQMVESFARCWERDEIQKMHAQVLS